MTHTRLLIAAAIIALVLIISFALSVPHTRDIDRGALPAETNEAPAVTLHDVFKKGIHTIIGSVSVPDVCTTVIANASVAADESATSSIVIALSLVKDDGICLQLPATVHFSTTVTAPSGLPLRATVDSNEARVTIL